jgi:hypothetical protein
MTLILTDVSVLFAPLADSQPRRNAEAEAVAKLVARAFGRDAIKTNAPDGAPLIEGSAASVSISHCRNLAALAVSPAGNPLGIDIERPRRQLATVAPRVLSPSELDYYSSFPSGLLQAWTLKEALYKAAGITGADFARQLRIPLPGHDFATAVKPSGEEIRFSVLFSAPIGFMPDVWCSLVAKQ